MGSLGNLCHKEQGASPSFADTLLLHCPLLHAVPDEIWLKRLRVYLGN